MLRRNEEFTSKDKTEKLDLFISHTPLSPKAVLMGSSDYRGNTVKSLTGTCWNSLFLP